MRSVAGERRAAKCGDSVLFRLCQLSGDAGYICKFVFRLAAFASDAIVLGRGRVLALDGRNEKSGVRNAARERVGQSGGCSADCQLKGQAAVHDATSRENSAGPSERQFLFHCLAAILAEAHDLSSAGMFPLKSGEGHKVWVLTVSYPGGR